LFCVFVLNVHTESGEGLVGHGFGMPFSHGSVELTSDLVSALEWNAFLTDARICLLMQTLSQVLQLRPKAPTSWC
jgi:hypothetical protein